MKPSIFLPSALLALVLVGTSSKSHGQDIERLKRAGDVQGLTAQLRNRDGGVRREAAIALPDLVRRIQSEPSLRPLIRPLVDATLKDTHRTVREYAGRALMDILQRTKDEAALRSAIPALVDTLHAGEVELKRRRYAAVALWIVVSKVDNEAALKPILPRVLAAALKDPDAEVREYARRPMWDILHGTEDQALLQSAVRPLMEALKHKDVKVRQNATVALSTVVPKLKGEGPLKRFFPVLQAAATKDADSTVREYAGRAWTNVLRRTEAAKE